MISQDLVRILVCPETRTPVTLADRPLLDQLNAAISAGRLTNKTGQKLAQPLLGALVRQDGAVAYPIVDEIPTMLIDEGIALAQLTAN